MQSSLKERVNYRNGWLYCAHWQTYNRRPSSLSPGLWVSALDLSSHSYSGICKTWAAPLPCSVSLRLLITWVKFRPIFSVSILSNITDTQRFTNEASEKPNKFYFKLINHNINHNIQVLCIGLIGNVARFLYISWLENPWWVLPFETFNG